MKLKEKQRKYKAHTIEPDKKVTFQVIHEDCFEIGQTDKVLLNYNQVKSLIHTLNRAKRVMEDLRLCD